MAKRITKKAARDIYRTAEAKLDNERFYQDTLLAAVHRGEVVDEMDLAVAKTRVQLAMNALRDASRLCDSVGA